MSYSKILVPLDGSSLSERALPLASRIAAQGGARVELLTVIHEKGSRLTPKRRPTVSAAATVASGEPSTPAEGASNRRAEPTPSHAHKPSTLFMSGAEVEAVESEPQSELNIPSYLADITRLLTLQDIRTTCKLRVGQPARSIVREAESEAADLIVMATHGRGGLARGLLGSVTDKTIHLSRIPVVVVRSDNAPMRWISWASPTAVIAPLDGSELSESGLGHAANFASTFFAQLILLRVMPQDATASEAALAERYLNAMTGRLRADGLDAHCRLARGAPAAQIARIAQDMGNSLIVMTTRGATGLTRWQRGSVTDAVIRSATVPTVVVPPVQPLLGPAIH